MKLVLVRTCESEYREENRFIGWTDSPLSHKGILHAHELGKKIAGLNIDIGIAYTSVLSRSKDTLKYIEEELGHKIKTRESYKLNARHYGVLEGKNKDEVRYMYGEEKIDTWHKEFDKKPPEIVITDARFPGNDEKYKDVLKFTLPLSESQKDVYERVTDYFDHEISTFLKVDENVLFVAHESTLRVLIKYLENISDSEIANIEIPLGSVIVYELDENLKIQNKEEL